MNNCPICHAPGGFHEDAIHSVPQPPMYVHIKKLDAVKQERPSDEEIARLRAEKLARKAQA